MTTLPRNPAPLPVQHLLESYTSSHPLRSPSPLPAGSRVDPKLKQRTAPPSSSSPLLWTIPTWIAFARFALAKGIHIIWSLLSHFLFGPKRRSWGYRMTFLTSFMRNVADHTSLADIVLIRRLISLHHIIPLPADAVVTPITFTVPLHSGSQVARGFMRELDLKETGTRELTGEWVVGTEVWKRLKAERRAKRKAAGTGTSPAGGANGGTPGEGDLGWSRDGVISERVIYYVHGGAYYVGNAATHRLITIGISKACNARVFAITYRLAPEFTFPLPLYDVLHGYLRLLAPPLSIPPENIVVMGDSAGGGMSLALCMYLRDEGYQLPGGLVIMSPWVDLTMSCGSWDDNADTDVVPRPEADDHLNPVGCYLGPTGIAPYVTHPYASPLFGNFDHLPPMLIQSGDSEVLRDEVTLLAHKATLAGVEVSHELYEDMVHVFQMFPFLPAAKAAINSIGRWVRVTLPTLEGGSRGGVSGVHDERLEEELEEDPTLVDREGRPARPKPHTPNRLGLDIPTSALPGVTSRPDGLDHESLDSRSGSPTPTISRSPTLGAADVFDSRAHAPTLRRALTSLETIPSPAPPLRKRRTTTASGATSVFYSPGSSVHHPSNPVSPTPSIRRRLRSPTISTTPQQPAPSTRHRSQSHSDIHFLVEGYVEGGAANETTVYAPGGEIRSVGVLGEDAEED